MNIAHLSHPFSRELPSAVGQLINATLQGNRFLTRSGSSDEHIGNFKKLSKEALRFGWRPELGYLRSICDAGNCSNAFLEAQLEIWKFLSNFTDNIDIMTDFKEPLLVCGAFVEEQIYSISGKNHHMKVCFGTKDKKSNVVVLERYSTRAGFVWLCQGEKVLEFDDWFLCRVVSPPCGMASLLKSHNDSDSEKDDSVDKSVLHDTLAAIDQFLPEYRIWLNMLLDELVLSPTFGRGSKSTSFHNAPGHIHMSMPCTIPYGITTLIHETSHQYFHLAQYVSSIADKNESAYSPLKEKHRPVEKILLGFHAFANALLALRIAAERGFTDPDFDRVYEGTRDYVQGLSFAINSVDKNKISDSGWALIAPLQIKIAKFL